MIVTIFRSRLAPGVQDEYGPIAREMSELVRSIPGHISHKGFVAKDGERATIAEFESERASCPDPEPVLDRGRTRSIGARR
jgi:antibiotic biosynthesis monooxygenase (ABM) superfamily enzyme